MCTTFYTDSPLYKLVESGHAPSRDSEGAWLGDLREVFCEEVRERCALSNDCEFVTTLHHLSSRSPLVSSGCHGVGGCGQDTPTSYIIRKCVRVQFSIRCSNQLDLQVSHVCVGGWCVGVWVGECVCVWV